MQSSGVPYSALATTNGYTTWPSPFRYPVEQLQPGLLMELNKNKIDLNDTSDSYKNSLRRVFFRFFAWKPFESFAIRTFCKKMILPSVLSIRGRIWWSQMVTAMNVGLKGLTRLWTPPDRRWDTQDYIKNVKIILRLHPRATHNHLVLWCVIVQTRSTIPVERNGDLEQLTCHHLLVRDSSSNVHNLQICLAVWDTARTTLHKLRKQRFKRRNL